MEAPPEQLPAVWWPPLALDTLDPKRRDLILRMATRLSRVDAGSRLADQTIHDALQLPGDAPPYTNQR